MLVLFWARVAGSIIVAINANGTAKSAREHDGAGLRAATLMNLRKMKPANILEGAASSAPKFWDTTTRVPPTNGHSPAGYFSSSNFAFTAVSISWYSFGSDFRASLAASRPCANWVPL